MKKLIQSRLIGVLGTVRLPQERLSEVADVLRQRQPPTPAELLDHAYLLGVVPQVARNAAALVRVVDSPWTQELARLAAERARSGQEQADELLAQTERFLERAGPAGILAVGIKGVAVAEDYPADEPRGMYDVDLLIAGGSPWEALRIFEEIGYYAPRVRVDGHDRPLFAGATHGIAAVTELDNAVRFPLRLQMRERVEPFDLHLGVFPGVGDTMLEADVGSRARRRRVGDQELPIPSIEDAILVMCAHLVRHGAIKLKDINDLHMLLDRRHGQIDWGYLTETARRNALDAVLRALLAKVRHDRAVEVPEERLREIAVQPMRRLAARFLTSGGAQLVAINLSQGGFFPGRVGQAIVLHESYRRRGLGRARALARAASDFWLLVKDARAYRTWDERQVRSLDGEHLVMAPIAPQADGQTWLIERVDLDRAAEVASSAGTPTGSYPQADVLVWEPGAEIELIFTPYRVYTQTNYRGVLDEPTARALEQRAWEVCSQLVDAGAMTARRATVEEAVAASAASAVEP